MASNSVLFISAPIGSGHIRAAQAVGHLLKITKPDCRIELCNVFDFFHPVLGQTILKTYLKALNLFPQAYGSVYSWGNESRLALAGREVISQLLARRMVNYINSFQPSVVVCTHATPAGLIAWCKQKGLLTVPAAAVITDFVVHRLWVYPELEHYFVAHDGMAEYLGKCGIAREAVTVTGIPVGQVFSRAGNREQILKQLKLDCGKRTILLMGGGAGLLPMEEILTACRQIDRPMQFIAVAGNNQQLYHKLARLAAGAGHAVRVLGYTDTIHELMSAADLLISKPGGMSTAEALALGVPLIIYRPIPGQEEANTQFLLANRAAVRADSLSDIITILESLFLAAGDELTNLRLRAAGLGRPKAANAIADFLITNYFY